MVGQSYTYRLSDVDYQGFVTKHKTVSVVVLDDDTNLRPGSFRVDKIFPNPFNPGTTIKYTLDDSKLLSISILDLQGRTVKTLTRNMRFDAGSYTVYWDGSSTDGKQISSGVYVAKIESKTENQVHKILKLD
jgi:hypothetical protein